MNLYDDPAHTSLAAELKTRLASARERVGDDGSHFPKCEAVLQEFWDYDAADKSRAIQISHDLLQRRVKGLEEGKRNVKTWTGK